ncbi:MAG: sulfatase-like hydrolase/transferase [Clostridia bacterium]|nr:sulfatase-like hydrolase/transferase [Clostridia bacterium]
MENKSKTIKQKIREISECIFLLFMGTIVVTYVMSYFLEGNLLGTIVHLFFKIAVISIFACITNTLKKPIIFYNVIEFIFGSLNLLKIVARCQPIEPWDLSLLGELGEISSFLEIDLLTLGIILIAAIFYIAVTILDVYIISQYCEVPSKKGKVLIFLITIPILIFLCTSYMEINMEYIESGSKGYANFTRFRRTSEYGGLVNFFLDLGIMNLENDDINYSEETMKDIYEKYEEDIVGKCEYDNVIVVLLESYYDMNDFANLKFEKDPLATYREYAKENGETKLLVNGIGGGTSNVEYQVLTMHSVDQYYEGIYPYMHLIKDDVYTLPQLFKDNGYETTAIHTYKKTFYNRDSAYEKMGIDRFIGDVDIENPEVSGAQISDNEIYEAIVETLETQEKSFITATTMGTHAPYTGFEYDEYDEWVVLEKALDEVEVGTNNYFQSLRNLDKMLGKLVEYINNSEERTLLIAYGDHYPLVYWILEEEGIVEKNDQNLSPEKYPELFETPYLVYSNVQNDIKTKEKIEPSEMGMYILENVKLEKVGPLYNGIYNYFKGNESLENYQLMQYDNIQGEQFWKKQNNK